jgi:hypothetical protein
MLESSHSCFSSRPSYTLFSGSLLQLLRALFCLCYLRSSSPSLHHALDVLTLINAARPLLIRATQRNI